MSGLPAESVFWLIVAGIGSWALVVAIWNEIN